MMVERILGRVAFWRPRFLVGVIILCCFFSGGLALAEMAGADRSAGSNGCCGLIIDPSDPRVLYATLAAGLFRSVDGGASWNPLLLGGFDLAVGAQDNRHVFALTKTSLVRSRDGGVTWTRLAFPAPPTVVRDRSFAFVELDPLDPDTVYIVDFSTSFTGINTDGRVYKSVDGGREWVLIGVGLVKVAALLIDEAAPQRLYVAGFAGGISRSNDGGTTWSWTPPGLYATWITSLVADPRDFSVLYDGTGSAGIFKSTDAGETWESANNGIDYPYPVVSNLTIARSRPTELLASTTTSDGPIVYRTDDGALSWREFLRGVSVLAIDPIRPEILYLLRDGRLLKSIDDGLTVADITPSYERPDSLQLPPRTPPRALKLRH